MTPLRVAAVSRNYFNMPLWVGQHRGFFAREGLEVELQLIEAIDEVTRRCSAGEVQLELGVTENVILARERALDRERGGDLVVVGGNVNRLPFSLIARPGIGSIADLRGRRIGVSSVAAGSSSLIMRLLAEHGLNHPADYEILAVGPILARWEKLQSGEIDAGLQGAPMNAIAIERGYVDLGSPRERFPDFQFTSLDVRRDWAGANRETLLAFLRAFLASHRWLAENREASRAIAVAETGISERHADLAWDEMVPGGIFPPDGRASLSAIQTLIDVSGQIRALPDRRDRIAADYVDHAFLDEAERQLG